MLKVGAQKGQWFRVRSPQGQTFRFCVVKTRRGEKVVFDFPSQSWQVTRIFRDTDQASATASATSTPTVREVLVGETHASSPTRADHTLPSLPADCPPLRRAIEARHRPLLPPSA